MRTFDAVLIKNGRGVMYPSLSPKEAIKLGKWYKGELI